jgi:outer membrane protein assembly factor BamB
LAHFLLFVPLVNAESKEESLLAAARQGDIAKVRELLDQGVDVNAKTRYGATALSFAADKGHVEIVKLLIERKADINTKDTFYNATPITWAYSKDRCEIVGLLLQAGATGGAGLLTGAARSGQIDMLKVVLATGQPKQADLDAARRVATKQEIIELLEKAGAKAPEPKAKVTAGPPLEPFVGYFKNAEAGDVEVAQQDGELVVKVDGRALMTLKHQKDDVFQPEGGSGTFEFRRKDSVVTGFVRKSDNAGDRVFDRVDKPISPAELKPKQEAPEPTEKVMAPANWPQFRGLGATGVADGQFPPTNFDATTGRNLRWKTPIPGLGHSCPVVFGDWVFITTAVGEPAKQTIRSGQYGDVDSVDDKSPHEWKVYCLDKSTGSVKWESTAHQGIPKGKRHLKSTLANPTPATDGRFVVASFGPEGLYCYDVNGRLKWKRELGDLDSGWFYDPDYQWGFGSSPIIFQDRVIIQCDVGKGSYLAAFALSDGTPLWNTPRDEIPSWGTPTVIHGPNRVELVTNGTNFARGYDPMTGQQLWQLGKHSEITVPTPFFGAGLIFVCSGYRPVQPIYAIRLGAKGDISLEKEMTNNDHIAWSVSRGGPYMPTPIVYGEHLYVCTNAGLLTCFEATTGKKLYSERIGGAGGYTASPVAADGRLYFTSEEGGVRVVRAGPKFELIAINPLGEITLATPAIADGLFIVRTKNHVLAFQRPTAGP